MPASSVSPPRSPPRYMTVSPSPLQTLRLRLRLRKRVYSLDRACTTPPVKGYVPSRTTPTISHTIPIPTTMSVPLPDLYERDKTKRRRKKKINRSPRVPHEEHPIHHHHPLLEVHLVAYGLVTRDTHRMSRYWAIDRHYLSFRVGRIPSPLPRPLLARQGFRERIAHMHLV